MKLKLTTTYSDVDHHWLKWWIETCGPNYMITPDVSGDRPIFPVTLESKDPTSHVVARTRIEIVEDDEPKSKEAAK